MIAAQATPPSEAIASPVSVPLVSPAPFVPLITFEQWFATLKRKPHHIHGMRVFAPTCGHLSASAWAERFAAY